MTDIEIPAWIDATTVSPAVTVLETETRPRWYVVVQSNHVSAYRGPYRRLHYANSVEEIHEMYPAPNYEIVEIFLMVASREPSLRTDIVTEREFGTHPSRYGFEDDPTRPMRQGIMPEGFSAHI